MPIKWIGAACVLVSCGVFGFSSASTYERTERTMKQLLLAIRFMTCELHSHATALPTLTRSASQYVSGPIRQILATFARILQEQSVPNASIAMENALDEMAFSYVPVRNRLELLGQTLGRFDLESQISGLESVAQILERDLAGFEIDKDIRMRSYRTLGICAGIALVILFI